MWVGVTPPEMNASNYVPKPSIDEMKANQWDGLVRVGGLYYLVLPEAAASAGDAHPEPAGGRGADPGTDQLGIPKWGSVRAEFRPYGN